ncbi:8595_t:CDS:2 [Cetraspora pellucida]|uniref:8595_t:CDS:1 n=1 Tax=Cetraspora pellucida TaxID=1433469 RepID=A0A9N9D2I7_9GLOM|nr:8595_t:CDS:2 [Cetraspora pellucida]
MNTNSSTKRGYKKQAVVLSSNDLNNLLNDTTTLKSTGIKKGCKKKQQEEIDKEWLQIATRNFGDFQNKLVNSIKDLSTTGLLQKEEIIAFIDKSATANMLSY